MPTFTESGTWTSPSAGKVDLVCKGKGGNGAPYDIAHSLGGGGGGGGGCIELGNIEVSSSEEFQIDIGNHAEIAKGGDYIQARGGGDSESQYGADGGATVSYGWSGTGVNGGKGGDGQNPNGGSGGGNGGGLGGGQGGTEQNAPFPGGAGSGGGGQALNGAGDGGASGGRAEATIVFYPVDNG